MTTIGPPGRFHSSGEKLWKRSRPQHAQKSRQRDRRNVSDPPGPSAAMRWLRRFGEPGWRLTKRLTENELSDFSRLWHGGCGGTIIEAQHVDRNHAPEV